MPTLTVETDSQTECIDITDRVAATLPDDADGVCTVFSQHTTMGVVVNEAESRLLDDLAAALDELIPDSGWQHDEIDDNADSHVRAMLVGESVTIPVADGTPQLGRWQSILAVECDGPRSRTLTLCVH
ncbi:secondary thiamine-phosphate synthase enzyme YjbQ [Halonotius pteroides]|uniref:YjbQ family protein n=1 Tax=Halonotius pteroides TaxID=268735 RepID=A0A3A6QBS3_9EURY|nr:secondary thiamine-phosphate synthase enzyme YjbQ [Halonotius pteroides]RJX50079.1 YjbQ family protein [Halonotius pteroides]